MLDASCHLFFTLRALVTFLVRFNHRLECCRWPFSYPTWYSPCWMLPVMSFLFCGLWSRLWLVSPIWPFQPQTWIVQIAIFLSNMALPMLDASCHFFFTLRPLVTSVVSFSNMALPTTYLNSVDCHFPIQHGTLHVGCFLSFVFYFAGSGHVSG